MLFVQNGHRHTDRIDAGGEGSDVLFILSRGRDLGGILLHLRVVNGRRVIGWRHLRGVGSRILSSLAGALTGRYPGGKVF